MRIKLSDYIAYYLTEKGIRHNFTVPGGGAMYLNASFGHQSGLHTVYMQHEQAAAIAAEGYYRKSGRLPLVCVTTGPGGTNALTGVLGAWLDSIPMLVISGQVKYSATVRSTGSAMRIFGDQEFDIVKAAAAMTKYAEMLTVPEMVQYVLDKALWLAQNGRPGPVWIDIPQNVQNAEIDTERLIAFHPEEMKNQEPLAVSEQTLKLITEKLRSAERPVMYAGVELRTHGVYDAFMQLAETLNIPVVTSFDGIDLIPDDHPLAAGRAGDVGDRYGNWAVQNSDLLLVIGSRLGVRQVSYATETWARKAYVIMVHEDPLELTKPVVHVEMPVRARLSDFIPRLMSAAGGMPQRTEWLRIIRGWKEHYPVVPPDQPLNDLPIDPYLLMDMLSGKLPEYSDAVTGNGTACVAAGPAFRIKKGQRLIMNSGAASMGYDLPAAVGVCFANDKQSVLCIAGDGSIQMNLQELQTVVFHQLPLRILIINNNGYHSMRLTQKNLFRELTPVGIGPETGDLGFPNMEKIAAAYGIPYYALHTSSEAGGVLDAFLSAEGPVMCEAFVDYSKPFAPKPTAKKLPDGRLVSPPLEDLAPFLPREELRSLMLIPLVDEEDKQL